MSVLQIYIQWASSVLAEVGGHVDGVEPLQDGKVLCELIDILDPDAGLLRKVKASGDCTALAYIHAALQHMSGHDVPVRFPAEDIVQNDVKSMLDVLWILILNYGIHFIGEPAHHRSIGIGKKNLLEWCQEKLGTTFDPKDTLTFSLCSNNWFIKLLEKVTHHRVPLLEDKSKYIDALLTQIEDRHLIKKDIIKTRDIVDGTLDEHSLMIYLSLLKRRVQHANRLSSDSHQRSKPSTPTEDVKETTESQDVSNSGRRRSSYANSDLKSVPSRGLYDHTHRDGTTDWSSLELQFSERETLLPKQLSSFQNSSTGNEAESRIIREKYVEQFPRAGIDSNAGKETESQMISEKETDTLSEFLSPIRERPVSGISSVSQERKHATRETNNAVVAKQNGTSSKQNSKLNSSTFKYNTSDDASRTYNTSEDAMRTYNTSEVASRTYNTSEDASRTYNTSEDAMRTYNTSEDASRTYNTSEDASRTYPSTLHKPHYGGSSQVQTEQHKWEMQEHRHRDYPRGEDARIKIKRPKDYIRQWEDTIDRLSTVSVTDEFGSPISPLISNYKVSLPVRSKSLETGRSSHRNPNGPSSTSSESHYTSGSRSRSSDVLPTYSRDVYIHNSSINHFQNPDSKMMPTLPERGNSGVEDASYRNGQTPSSIHLNTQDSFSVPPYTIRSEASTLKENITASRDLYSAVPHDSISANKTQYKGLFEATELPILKRRDRFEPPSSGSRVRFQPQSNIISHHEQRSFSERPQPCDLNGGTSSTVQRVHSLSPQRQMVNSHSLHGGNEMGSDATLSARSRFMPSHLSLPTARVPEADTNFNLFESPSENITAHLQSNGKVHSNLNSKTRLLSEDISSPTSAGSLSCGASNIEYPKEGCTLSSSKTYSQRPPLNTAFKDVPGLDSELDLDMNYVGHLREDSPPPISRGGVSRVPRREAWERDRRKKEDLSIIEDQIDIVDQPRNIEVLYNDVEVLKEKVELLEDGGTNRFHSATDNTRHIDSVTARKIIDEISQMAAVEKIKASLSSHERSLSCPLLQPSRRSKATRSFSRSSSALGTSESKPRVYPEVSIYLDRNSRTRSTSNSKYSPSNFDTSHDFKHHIGISNGRSAHKMSPDFWEDDLNSDGCLDPNKLEKLKWLISRHDLSEYEISELKQSLASVLAENDILQTKLTSFRYDIHDKLKHTNGVLDDCRHHLAKAQAQNMELRTVAEQEKHKSEAYGHRIKELEKNLAEMKADNEQLEDDLDQTSTLLNHSVNKTKPGVDALKKENCTLTSMLVNAEHENYDLREEIHVLKQNQTKAVNTMDDLRECLFKVRRERQELFEELTSLQRQEQTDRVRKIITSYQEKGAQDEWDREQNLMEEARRAYLDHPGPSSNISPDSSYFPPSFRQSRILDDHVPQRSKLSDRESFQCSSWKYFSPRQHSRFDEESPTQVREIYPHRRNYASRSRSYSPHLKGRSASSPGYYSPLPMDKSFPDYNWPERDRQKFGGSGMQYSQPGGSGMQYSQPELRFSHSPVRHRAARFRSCTPSRSRTQSPHRTVNFEPLSAQYRLNRSFSSAEDLSARPFQHSANLGIFKSRNRIREKPPAAVSNQGLYSMRFSDQDVRNQGLYSMRFSDQDFSRSIRHPGNHQSFFKSSSPERDPDNFFRSNYSALNPGSVVSVEKQSFGSKMKRRPVLVKREAEEIARIFQKEFEKEDKRISSLSKSQNTPWIDLQSESDGEDTGINSSMSSRSSCEQTYMRKRTTVLSDEQRRYADELIKKYTGNIPLKQVI